MSPHLQLVSLSTHTLLLASTATTTAPAKSSGSSSTTLILLVLIFGVAYFLFLRPRSQRAKARQAEIRNSEIGDEVMLTSGIIGTITSIEGDRARIEIAPGTEIEVVRAAISQRVTPPLADSAIAADSDDDDDSHLPDNPFVESAEHSDDEGTDSEDAAPDSSDPEPDDAPDAAEEEPSS